MNKMLHPRADFESFFNFYYDETNNVRKFYVREFDFNSDFNSNFVLGGLVYEGKQPNIKLLFDQLNLQKNITEAKLKHIAKGEFLDCLKSEKLNIFLKCLLENDLYIHYSSVNILYWSIIDIVDSAIQNSEVAKQSEQSFSNYLKNDLYKLAKLEINLVINLFYDFGYPNLKKESVSEFIEELTSIFDKYIDMPEFHFGLGFFRQILKEAKNKNSLPFIMDEEDHILIRDFSDFYLNRIYCFKNSNHVFDNEVTISEIISKIIITDGNHEVKNYSFIDSQSNLFIQASDIFVGLMGKFFNYTNTSTREKIISDFESFSERQLNNVNILMNLIEKSHNKNVAFLHSIDSYEEIRKIEFINKIRNKKHA